MGENTDYVETVKLNSEQTKLAAFWARVFCGCNLDDTFNPVFVMENVLGFYDKSFSYEIIDKDEWQFGENCQGKYIPSENTILLRGDVYEAARRREKMAVITVSHEVVHCIQKIIKDVLFSLNIPIATEKCSNGSAEMARHEDQTDVFTRFMLCPFDLMEGLSDRQAVDYYVVRPLLLLICQVAADALDIKNNSMKKEGEKCDCA